MGRSSLLSALLLAVGYGIYRGLRHVRGRLILIRGQRCIGAIKQGLRKQKGGDIDRAGDHFVRALKSATSVRGFEMPKNLRALALLHIAALGVENKKPEAAERVRSQALPLVDVKARRVPLLDYDMLMADVLRKLHEYHRAIPFYEAAIQTNTETTEPLWVATMLWKAGNCHSRCGHRDHAAVFLKESLKIFRSYGDYPLLPVVMGELAGALARSSPSESERLYIEAADWSVDRGKLQSATTYWVNLGILYSRQERHEEALECYKRALQVRLQSPTTPPRSMGSLHNNMANCYRRKGSFEEAHQHVTQAIRIFEELDEPMVAAAYGTYGLIFRDELKDEEAVTWLQAAYTVRSDSPSPNSEAIAEDLEAEIGALQRLGRLDGVRLAQERLAAVNAARGSMAKAHVDVSAMSQAPAEGRVIVELAFGSHSPQRTGLIEGDTLYQQLVDAVGRRNLEYTATRITMADSTSILLSGENAEELFESVVTTLLTENLCRSAVVTIRQGFAERQFLVPA